MFEIFSLISSDYSLIVFAVAFAFARCERALMLKKVFATETNGGSKIKK